MTPCVPVKNREARNISLIGVDPKKEQRAQPPSESKMSGERVGEVRIRNRLLRQREYWMGCLSDLSAEPTKIVRSVRCVRR